MTELVPSTGARTTLVSAEMASAEATSSSAEAAGTSTATTKRKRHVKPETGGKQAKLAFGNGKAQLRISDDEELVITGESSKIKPRRRKEQGEEAERKAMAARNKAAKRMELEASRAAAKVKGKPKGKDQTVRDSKDSAITILSSSPPRGTSPQEPNLGLRSRASTAETLVVGGGPESTSGHVSIVIDSDGDEAESSKAKHPFFIPKTASGGQDDPILLGEELPAKPKMMRVTDSRPAHSFFSSKGSGSSTSMERQASNTSTAGKRKAKKEHGFFSPPRQGPSYEQSIVTKPGWGNDIKEGHEWLPPWPTAQEHHIWPTNDKSVRLSLPSRKGKEPMRPEDNFWDHFTAQAGDTSAQSRCNRFPTDNTFPYISSHPAFAACQDTNRSTDDWCRKYAPTSAAQVLGNEAEAAYLRDWIHALQVGVVTDADEAQSVIRTVSRPSKRTAGTSWIAYDEDPVEGYEDPKDSELVEEPQTQITPDQLGRPSVYPSLSDRLTNTIVLTGPSGVGKTAAVYAVAHELGWDVFEVYPGIGKRNASSLTSMVGEVSRNHMVAKSGRPEAKSDTKPSAMIDLTTESKIGYLAERDSSNPAKAMQSVILLEEVDILYEDDKNFWQAVVGLIADSKRPVILTCNDLSLVPCSQLPLQTVLRFDPPPSHLMIPYLEAIARNENTSYIPPLVRGTPSALRLYHPLPPRNSQPESSYDLRQSLQQLQLGLEQDNSDSAGEWPKDFEGIVKQLDNLSYADAWITQRPLAAQESLETDVYEPTTNDEIGHNLLYKPSLASAWPTLPSYGKEEDIAQCLCPSSYDQVLRQLARDRATYMASTLSFLDELIALDSYLLPSPCLFIDYIPPIRRIVQADDILEHADRAAAANGDERTNRRTGRPMRLTAVLPGSVEFIRYLNLPAPALEDARSGSLV